MNQRFRNSTLALAVGAALTTTIVPTAQAANLTDTGLGEVIMVPYYTVRNGYDTYMSLVNTSDKYVVAVKVRFREADNSRDARDFNVFLSPNDVWTAAVTMSDDGETPVVQTMDNSCTAPALSPGDATVEGAKGVKFTSLAYDGTGADYDKDGGATDITRTQDGHIEVIEMGVADPEVSGLAAAAVHTVNGTPANCQRLIDEYSRNQTVNFGLQFKEPLNVLKGAAALIKVDAGKAIGVPVDTIANFYNPTGKDDPDNPSDLDIMRMPASTEPQLDFVTPATAVQVLDGQALTQGPFARPIDAISSLYMASSVVNEFGIEGAANAETDWVLTFPTKNFYVDRELSSDLGPFEFFFQGDADGNGKSCVTVTFNYFDREEQEPGTPPDELGFSPRPEDVPIENAICEETQVLYFGAETAGGSAAGSSLLGASNAYGVPLQDGIKSGWMRLQFPDAGQIDILTGLPVHGFAMRTLENGVANDNLLNYGIASRHAFERTEVESVVEPQ